MSKLIEYFGLLQFFIIVSVLDNHNIQSNLEIGKKLMEGLQYYSYLRYITYQKVIMEFRFLLDSVYAHKVAEKIGVDCVLILSCHHTLQKLEKCGVPVLCSIKEVLTIVDEKPL